MKEDYEKLGEYSKSTTDWVLAYRDSMEDSLNTSNKSEEVQ